MLYGILNLNAQPLIDTRYPAMDDFVFAEDEPVLLNFEEINKRIGYPSEALKAKIEGKVFCRILVDKQGNCINYVTTRASHPLLKEAVKPFVRQLHFIPAKLNNDPLLYWTNVVFTFDIKRFNRNLHVRRNPLTIIERKIISNHKKAEKHLQAAISLKKAGQYEEALQELWKSKRRNPTNRKGNALIRSIKINYHWGQTYFALGQHQMALEKMTEAIGLYLPVSNRYEELDKLAPGIYLDRAICLLKLDEPIRAIQDLNLVIIRFPEYAGRGFNIKGLAYSKLQNHEEALANVQRAIELDPVNPESFVFKAMVLYSLEGSRAARENLNYAEVLGMNLKQSQAFMQSFR